MTAKKPSLLSRGATPGGDAPTATVWWRDPRRLLAHVIVHARCDSAFAAEVARAVGELAANSEQLRDAIKEGQAKRGRGPAKTSPGELHRLLDSYLILRAPPHNLSSADAEVQLGEMFKKSQERIHGLLAEARKLRKLEKSGE